MIVDGWLLCLCLQVLVFPKFTHAAPLTSRDVDLQEARVSEAYKKVLSRSFDRLTLWSVVNQKPSPESLEFDTQGMNDLLISHIQFLFKEQAGVSAGRHAILTIQYRYRHLKTQLVRAWDSIKSWEQLEPIRSRVPMPWIVLESMFYYGLLQGFEGAGRQAREWISWSVCLIMGFDALLRPCEICATTIGKLALPTSRLHSLVGKGLVTVTNGKNRRMFGRVQIAVLDNDRVLRWLSWLSAGLPVAVHLLAGGTARFRALFKQAIHALGLQSLGLTPSSLRAGGAT